MKRGGVGKPYPAPDFGWPTGGVAPYPECSRHRNKTTVDKFVNNTERELQYGLVGRPETRKAFDSSLPVTCATQPFSGLPLKPWIGTGDDQYLMAALQNSYIQTGTVDLQTACHVRGFKNVQAVRQWNGRFGFLSHDPLGLGNIDCGSGSYQEDFQGSPDQVKYLTETITCTLTQALQQTIQNYDSGGTPVGSPTTVGWSGGSECSQQISVGATTGKLTLDSYTKNDTTAGVGAVGSSNAIDPAFLPASAYSSWANAFATITCGGHTLTAAGWAALTPYDLCSPWVGYFLTVDDTGTTHAYMDSMVMTLTNTNVKIEFVIKVGDFTYHNGDGSYSTHTFSGSIHFKLDVVLTDASNTPAAVKSDAQSLLAYWDMSDDKVYPWRTDGLWQIAPLMSRDEQPFNVSPHQFPPFTVDDRRLPNGDGTYQQMTWFDTSAYGFIYPYGHGDDGTAATDLVQYKLTGKILGMPLPVALTDGSSAWYRAGTYASGDYQDFFDFNAEVWAACQSTDGFGTVFVDFYRQGYGDWNSAARGRTGAQIPTRATQWTNNYDAFYKPNYAYMMQANAFDYDVGATATQKAPRSDGLWVQKCAEVIENWPSENWFRPAGADKFAYDETQVYCYAGGELRDSTGTLVTAASLAGVWGGTSVGGFYTGCSSSVGVLTLGTLVLGVPSDWSTGLGDEANAFGKLRWPDKPAILGRDAIKSITDNGDGTLTIELYAAETNLTGVATGAYADNVDVNTSALVAGCETLTVVSSNKTATRIDDTHFKITETLATITGAKWLTTHGANAWYWDSNRRRGDVMAYDWTLDLRTNAEVARVAGLSWAGCAAHSSGSSNYGYTSFNHVHLSLPATACDPTVVCWSPNNESFTNGVTFGTTTIGTTVRTGWPAALTFDDRYGAQWRGEIEQATISGFLTDQTKHNPNCDGSLSEMDDGTCKANYTDGGGHSVSVYAHYQFVGSRWDLPATGGCSGTETAPATVVTFPYMSYLSPVGTNVGNVLYPADIGNGGMIGVDANTGTPSAAWTFWGYRITIEDNCESCRFDYAGLENFTCTPYVAPPAPADTGSLEGLGGLT